MKIIRVVYFLLILFSGCNPRSGSQSDDAVETSRIPELELDIKLPLLGKEIKNLSRAEKVKISRPFVQSGDINSCWIRITLEKPILPQDKLASCEQIATIVKHHLINKIDFKEIEIVVNNKSKVFAISKSESFIFVLDSLSNSLPESPL